MTKLIYYTAEWCGPCKQFGPLLMQEAEARGLEVEKRDVDTHSHEAQAHGVISIPTVLVTDERGEVLDRIGFMPPHRLRARLDEAVGA